MKIKTLLLAMLMPILMPVLLVDFVANAEPPVQLKYTRQELQAKWRERLQSFLDKGVIPIIDMESTISRKQAEDYLYKSDTLKAMDELGLALVVFDSTQAAKGGGQ